MSWQTRLIGVHSLIVVALCPLGAGAATVGLDPCDGLTMFVKEFVVPIGTTITGVTFQNNDARTVFPEVVLVRGGDSTLRSGTVVAQATDLGETAAGQVRVTWSVPVSVTEDAKFRVGVRFPEGSGKQGDGDGPGVGAVRVETPNGSFVAGGADAELTAVPLDLSIQLVTSEAGKAGADQQAPPSVQLRTFLAVAAPNLGQGAVRLAFGLERASNVSLSIYDVSGRLVRRLVSGALAAATYERQWDGRDAGGRTLAAGVYIVKLEAADRVLTEKLVLVR